MILTVTLNPSLDKTVEIPGPLDVGAVHRASGVSRQPGGKGINVSTALHAAAVSTLALYPGNPDDSFNALMESTGIPRRRLDIEGLTRTNTAIVSPNGTTTKVNEPGPVLTEQNIEDLIEATVALSRDASWLVLAGSLPASALEDLYPRIIRTVRERLGDDAPLIALDTSDAPLAEALAPHRTRDELPDLIKPNGDELASLTGAYPELQTDTGRSPGDELEANPSAVVGFARTVTRRGVGTVLATLGGSGAVLVTEDSAWHARHAPIHVRSTVGAGDSSLAGYLIAADEGLGQRERLKRAVACGSAAARLPGTTLPSPSDLTEHLVELTDLNPSPAPASPAAH